MATWAEIGKSNYGDAELLEEARAYRSAISRYYYSAFSVITSELIRRRADTEFSAKRETPGHAQIAGLVDKYFLHMSEQRRRNLIRETVDLYRSRIEADYGLQRIDRSAASQAHQTAERVLRYLGAR